MANLIANTRTALKAVHEGEEGMEALQTVLIIALAAIILAFAYKMFGGNSSNDSDSDDGDNTVIGWVLERLNNVFGWK